MATPKQLVLPYNDGQDGDDARAAAREERDVHGVYEAIAPHFSSTRYKPWPLIAAFLASIPPNSLGLDAGAGNGKYAPVLAGSSAGSRMIALDRSMGLLSIARGQSEGREECVRGDLCFEGWREGVFDFAISIAAIHHLSTHPRRVISVRALLRPLAFRRTTDPAGLARFIVYVWAYEQGEGSKRRMGVRGGQDREGGHGEGEQDVLVPWVLQAQTAVPRRDKAGKARMNRKRTNGEEGATPEQSPPAVEPEAQPASVQPPSPSEPTVYRRYYHLFKEGELQDLVLEAARAEGLRIRGGKDETAEQRGGEREEEGDERWMRIRGVGYERDNWWLEGEVGLG